MAYSLIELEFQFTDKTTKKWQVGPFASNSYAVQSLKANVKSFNANYDGVTDPLNPEAKGVPSWYNLVTNENGAKLLFSANGYPDVPILNATIITRNETEINLYN